MFCDDLEDHEMRIVHMALADACVWYCAQEAHFMTYGAKKRVDKEGRMSWTDMLYKDCPSCGMRPPFRPTATIIAQEDDEDNAPVKAVGHDNKAEDDSDASDSSSGGGYVTTPSFSSQDARKGDSMDASDRIRTPQEKRIHGTAAKSEAKKSTQERRMSYKDALSPGGEEDEEAVMDDASGSSASQDESECEWVTVKSKRTTIRSRTDARE